MAVITLDRVIDLTDRLLAQCAANRVRPDRVRIIDPGDPHWVIPCNPLLGPGEPHVVADGFVDAIHRHSESWGVEIDHSLRHIVRTLVIARQSPLEIGRLFHDPVFRETVTRNLADPTLRDYFAHFESLSNEQRQQRFLAIDNKVSRFTSNPQLRRILCANSSLDFRAIIDDPAAILLVCLRKDQLHSGADLLGDLVVQALWNAALSRATLPEGQRPKCLLILDEAQNFARQCLSEIVAEGRRYGVRLCLAHQSQAQLKPDLQAILRNNAAVRMIFNVGPVDAREMAAELLPLDRNTAIESLLRLQTGEAYVVRRGLPATRVVTPNVPPADHRSVRAFREHSMRCHASRVADIDDEMMRRNQTFPSQSPSPQEVHHVRSPRV